MNKKSSKFVLFFYILMMVMPFFIFNVGALDVTLEDFDSYAEGVHSGSNAYLSWEDADDDFVTSTTHSVSGSMSLKGNLTEGDDVNCYFNFSDSINITSFEFWFRYSVTNAGATTYVSLLDGDTAFIKFRIQQAITQQAVDVYDYNGWHTFYTIQPATWVCIGFQGNYSVGNPINYVYYYVKDVNGELDGSVEKRWISLDEFVGKNLDSIIINNVDTDSTASTCYIDDFTIPDYTPADYEGDFAFESNDNIGSLDTSCTLGLNYKELEFKYHTPVTINATGFDLLVDSSMYSTDDNLANYDLYINSEFMNYPTEWKKYGDKYVLRWEFTTPKVITNSEILYEIWHDLDGMPVNYMYWNVGVGCWYVHMDNDGRRLMRHSNTYPNGIFDGTFLEYDVAYQIYFDTISFVEDVIDFTYNSITTIDVPYYVGDPIPLTYTIKTSDLIYDNHVRIWNTDTDTEITIDTMQGFPYLCKLQVETVGFVPFTSANYTAFLYINDVEITNVTFFVYDLVNPDMYVYTYPNPSKVGQEMRVEYNYDHPSNKSGAIFLCTSPNLNTYISVNHLSDGDSGFWKEKHYTAGNYYYILAVDITGNGSYGIVDDGIHPHTVINEQTGYYFKLGGYNLRLSMDGTATQVVSGECSMIFGNCFIYDNNKLIKTITESPFSYSYEIYTAGLHTVEMRLITNVTTVLFTQNYSVSTFTGEDEIDEIEDTSFILRNWVYDIYGDFGVFIVGVCVVLGFMFIPFALVLYINVAYNKNIALGDMHWSVYIIFAIVGVIVDVQLHLAELWIILLVCVVSIAITVVTYKGKY